MLRRFFQKVISQSILYFPRESFQEFLLYPLHGNLLKSLFFVLTDQSTRQNMNYLSTQFQHRGLLQYRVVIGGLPLNADWVNVYNTSGQNTFSESLYAL